MVALNAAHKPAPAAKKAKPAPFPHPDLKIGSFSFAERATALCLAERMFGVSLGGQIPRVEIVFTPPTSGPVAEEFNGVNDQEEAFKKDGPVSWQHRGVIHFNSWKLPPTKGKRESALAHEMAHILLAVHAGRHGQIIHDKQAYMCATEGVATFAEIESRRASGIEWKGFPEGTREEYLLGFAFFNSIRDAVGTEGAFHLIASNLPRSMQEIADPQLYLRRVAQERGLAQAVA